MGYATEHRGVIRVCPPLNAAEREQLLRLARTRHAGTDEPGYWCDWMPTADGHLALPEGLQRSYAIAEWLVWLRDRFLVPGAPTQGRTGFDAFTLDHALRGAVAARGQVEGDRWTLVAGGDRIGVLRTRLPCADCWADQVRALVPPSAAHRFDHPDLAAGVGARATGQAAAAPARGCSADRCRAGGFRPSVTWQPAVWPIPGRDGPLRPAWEAPLASLLGGDAIFEHPIDLRD